MNTGDIVVKPNKPIEYDASQDNVFWRFFTSYVLENKIKGFKDIKKPPNEILLMLGDQNWCKKMKNHFLNIKRPRKRELMAQQKSLKDLPGSDADAEEIDEMDLMNPYRIEA